MIPIIKTNRTRAMEWWNGLSVDEKIYYSSACPVKIISKRSFSSLTGREIQIIWEGIGKPKPKI